jgi:Alcohol acetyltransferase
VLGRLYSARNVLGFYRLGNALAVCTYSTDGLSDADSWFMERFSRALYQTVRYHPSLCYGIVDQTPEREAVFMRLPAIYYEDVVHFRGQDLQDPSEQDDDRAIETLLEDWHAKILTDGHQKPAWRVVILKHGSQWGSGAQRVPPIQKVSIAFLANHAIADGISHVNFHRTLFHFFNKKDNGEGIWPYIVPRDLRCPVLLEDVVDLLAKDEEDMRHISYDTANLWSGTNVFLPSPTEYESGLRLITIPLSKVKRVLGFCKSKQISLTGLLHGLVVTYLARTVPPGCGFRAVTPYSMRQISKVSDNEICNHVSALVHDFPEHLVTNIRNSPESPAEDPRLIVKVAQRFYHDMSAELKRTPKNNVWASLFGDNIDWYAQAKGQLGKKRALTYEVSNVGSQRMFETQELQDESLLKLEKMAVSQCGSVAGPVVAVNCISTPGGPLTITLAWQRGSCEEQLINDMVAYLSNRLVEDFEDVTEARLYARD